MIRVLMLGAFVVAGCSGAGPVTAPTPVCRPLASSPEVIELTCVDASGVSVAAAWTAFCDPTRAPAERVDEVRADPLPDCQSHAMAPDEVPEGQWRPACGATPPLLFGSDVVRCVPRGADAGR